MKKFRYDLLLKWILWLVAIHSICFGISLVILPINIIELFGFHLTEKFFADHNFMVIFSGLEDFLMGFTIMVLYILYRRQYAKA
jgi:hypothetical protein